ncbi:MAG: formylglycine-generating enzyme family protein [Halioglobus sp.]
MRAYPLKLSVALLFALAPLIAATAEFDTGKQFTDSLRSGGKGPNMVVIPQGNFVLGGGRPDQKDLGRVTIDYSLAFSTTEITNAQYRQFLESSLSGLQTKFSEGAENQPIAGLSFDEAEAYVGWLSRESGHHYRLPSASEWEYAARAGTTTPYSWGSDVGDNNANCMDCNTDFTGSIAPVGSFAANPWGLHDMHGNVWEWTKDCIDSNMAPPDNGMPTLFGNCDLRELRGGSINSDAWSIRASVRASALRSSHTPDLGFRVAMEVPL